MIAKAAPEKRRRRAKEALEVRLSVKVNFGETPADAVTVMDDRAVPMVNSVFDNRDRILRLFAMTLVRVGLSQPGVVRELFPAARLLRKLRGK